MRRRRRLAWWLIGACALALPVAGYGLARQRRAPLADQLPQFTEPGVGPRAPTTTLFGFQIGRTSLDQVKQRAAQQGWTCQDTSMRALMQAAREQKRREYQERKARGENVDAISGASALNRRSPKEANPQVRLSCDGVPGQALPQEPRPGSRGRLLFVFDSPKHPLRHLSFDRTYPPALTASAEQDRTASEAALQARFGAAAVQAASPRLQWLSPVETEWRFADLTARVTAVNYGARGVVVSELVEVPWPVRADAPAR